MLSLFWTRQLGPNVRGLCNRHYHHHHNYNDNYDVGYPAYSHQSYSHQVGICHNDEGWEYDTVKFPPHPCIMISIVMRGGGVCGQTRQVEPLRHPPDIPRHHSATPRGTANKWQNLSLY